METQYTSDMLEKLVSSIDQLEYSVVKAYDSFLAKYGEDHKHTDRLRSYFMAIEKQRECITELQLCVSQQDLDGAYQLTNKIVAMSEMIKNDAKIFLMSLGSETFDESMNEIVQ